MHIVLSYSIEILAGIVRVVAKTFMTVVKVLFTLVLIVVLAAGMCGIYGLVSLKHGVYYDISEIQADFQMSLSSSIWYVDKETGEERELVTLPASEFRVWVDYETMPVHLVQALVAIEDHRFFEHDGVDWFRTVGAVSNLFLESRDSFGGSTITQQLIKNITGDKEVTIRRKINEIFMALEYEKFYRKEEIVELYLNLVYFGHGCYGVGAASNYYFGKDVSELSVAESAAIVSITNNPSKYSPYSSRSNNKERQRIVLKRMYELGYIETEKELFEAISEELLLQRGADEVEETVTYTWFEEAVIRDVLQDLVEVKGFTEQMARVKLYAGGLKIVSTLDPDMQSIVDNYYTNPELMPIVKGSDAQVQSGIVIIDPYTSEIKALSGGIGVKEGNMLLSRATMARRPPGSSIKPIASYAPAMDSGLLTPDTRFYDSSALKLSGTIWLPKNSDRKNRGLVTARQALQSSLNTIASVILDQLTPSVSYDFMCNTLGFDLDSSDADYAPLAIGQLTHGATVREMATAYTIFPNGGEFAESRTYTVVYDENGDVYMLNERQSARAISEVTAYWMTDMLVSAVTYGTGSSANLRTIPTAGKTGTSNDDKDRWFVGFTPYYVAAVWTGFDRPAAMQASSNPAAQIWKMIMTDIHLELERKEFNKPENTKQDKVPGVAVADYTIKCVDSFGTVLSSETKSSAVGYYVSVNAPLFDGYNLISSYELSKKISSETGDNIFEFTYVLILPPVVEEGPTEDIVDSNSADGVNE